MTLYWFLVWYIYFTPEDGGPIQFGHNGGRWVYYSWFLLGIFGLNLSKYGLVGLEAGMLMDKRWAATNAMQIMVCESALCPNFSVVFSYPRLHETNLDISA